MNHADLAVASLLADLDGLGAQLAVSAREGSWLDAYLLAAGIHQIAEDHIHASRYLLDEASAPLRAHPSWLAHAAGQMTEAAARSLRGLRHRRPGSARIFDWEVSVRDLVGNLAQAALGGSSGSIAGLTEGCEAALRSIGRLPMALRRTVLRLPACFQAFDQRPEDLILLAHRFAERFPDLGQPLAIVGVRTSGSYLAPLLGAALRSGGYRAVQTFTVRPGHLLLARERDVLRSVADAGGLVLLIDDPPVSGSSLAKAAREVTRCGVRRNALVPVLALDRESALMPASAWLAPVLIHAGEWAIHARLTPQVLASDLAPLLRGRLESLSVEMLPLPAAASARRHHRVLLRVSGRDPRSGAAAELQVLASGAGLGYFGARDCGVAQALGGLAAPVLGARDGVVFREWIPAERRVQPGQRLAADVARYVAARRDTLSVPRDFSLAMRGQRPVWEVVSVILARSFARAELPARFAVVDRCVGRLLKVTTPTVLDGDTRPQHWYGSAAASPLGAASAGSPVKLDSPGSTVKVGVSARTNWRLGLACSDPIFDLAGVGAFSPDGSLAGEVRRAWKRETGEVAPAERWLLYELAHLWGLGRADDACEATVRHGSARATQRYFASVFLSDLPRLEDRGALCALDVDGVLESDLVGFPTLTRASAMALRCLLAHGYQPVPVTGRGIEEVRDRCRSFGLAAGVAEYGAALYLSEGDRLILLANPSEAKALDRVRGLLEAVDGIRLDPAFRSAIRAYRLGAGGRRVPPATQEVRRVLDRANGAVSAIRGRSQVDFVAAGIDKGTGLRALQRELSNGGRSPAVALAVGDTSADAGMLALAQRSRAPAHARDAALGPGVKRLPKPYQRGLALAVGELVGHPPGACSHCHSPRLTREAKTLIDLISIPERSRWSMLTTSLRLAAGSK